MEESSDPNTKPKKDNSSDIDVESDEQGGNDGAPVVKSKEQLDREMGDKLLQLEKNSRNDDGDGPGESPIVKSKEQIEQEKRDKLLSIEKKRTKEALGEWNAVPDFDAPPM